ncbi:heavy-metal-associated domain-containing protein [Fuchsiella alkaliacetigena]|uniref:heavy-metal-associated domain-containing protein n=1 Tax=Fuchsiella alkaliacetigena TaxID=957042 RepID=UPI00200B9ED5|nr:copper ion binding protein [Fuchsiella alkaliacetigena]MCK8824073.1 copper ion binding protein [Fuchsiella alkaliacetigena]
MSKEELKVTGMSCGHCKGAVEEAVSALSGVEAVEVDLDSELVKVDFEAATVGLAEIEQAIEEAGPYQVE